MRFFCKRGGVASEKPGCANIYELQMKRNDHSRYPQSCLPLLEAPERLANEPEAYKLDTGDLGSSSKVCIKGCVWMKTKKHLWIEEPQRKCLSFSLGEITELVIPWSLECQALLTRT